jgi:hypothetical protein
MSVQTDTARVRAVRVRMRGLIERLRRDRTPSTREIADLLDHAEVARPLLIETVAEAARWESVPDRNRDGPVHAIFLLAAMGSFEAWSPIDALLRRSFEAIVDPLLDENLVQTLPWALARIAADRPEALMRHVDDATLALWVRVAALESLSFLAEIRPLRRPSIVAALRRWLPLAGGPGYEELGPFLAYLVQETRSGMELRSEVAGLFARGLVSWHHMRSEREIFEAPPRRIVEPTWDIFDMYEHHGAWIGSHDPAHGGRGGPW